MPEVSPQCKEAIKGMLTASAGVRWSAVQVVECQWLSEDVKRETDQMTLAIPEEDIARLPLESNFIPAEVLKTGVGSCHLFCSS